MLGSFTRWCHLATGSWLATIVDDRQPPVVELLVLDDWGLAVVDDVHHVVRQVAPPGE